MKTCTAQARAREVGGDGSLNVGEGEDEVGPQRFDAADVGGRERGHTRLLAAHFGRPHGIAGDADDAVLLTEEIERFYRFLGEGETRRRAGY